MRPMLLVLLLLALAAIPACAQTDPNTPPALLSLSPVVLVPVTSSGFSDALAGVSLSVHPIRNTTWAGEHLTLEFPVSGTTWDQLSAGFGVAVNLKSQEGIALKLGAAYVTSIAKPCIMTGISIPLG